MFPSSNLHKGLQWLACETKIFLVEKISSLDCLSLFTLHLFLVDQLILQLLILAWCALIYLIIVHWKHRKIIINDGWKFMFWHKIKPWLLTFLHDCYQKENLQRTRKWATLLSHSLNSSTDWNFVYVITISVTCGNSLTGRSFKWLYSITWDIIDVKLDWRKF